MSQLDPAEAREIARRHLRRVLEDMDQGDVELGAVSLEESNQDEAGMTAAVNELKAALRTNDPSAVSSEVDETLQAEGKESPEGSEARHRLGIELLKATTTAAETALARLRGDVDQEEALRAKAAAPAEPVKPAEPVQPQTPTILEAFEDFAKEKRQTGKWTRETSADDNREGVRQCTEIIGNKRVGEVTREDCKTLRDRLLQLPSNWTKRPEYRDKTIPELLEMDIPEDKRLRPNTVNQTIGKLSSLLKYMVREGVIPNNPASEISVAYRPESYGAFSTEQLKLLFNSKRYTKSKHDRPWKFWLPLLGLYTGARLGELAQLQLTDVTEEQDIPMLWIQDESGNEAVAEKQTKTEAARRRVPIHSQLQALGFLDHVATQRERGNVQVFPSLEPGHRGRWSDQPSRWFSQLRQSVGLNKYKGRYGFHSFRSTVITRLLQDYPEQHVQEIVGHEQGSVTYDVYFKGLDAERLRDMVESLDYGLDFEALKGTRPR